MMFVPPFPKVGEINSSFQDIHEVTQPRQWAKTSSQVSEDHEVADFTQFFLRLADTWWWRSFGIFEDFALCFFF